MGHAFQQTLMDALIRYHRMRGDNTNWVVGTDHAGIATEIVVTRQIEAEGKSKRELGREEFNRRVWQWKQQSGSTITRQMRRLGASGNWEYADTEGQKAGYYTADAKMSRAVTRGLRPLVRGRADLPRQAAGELGPGARHHGVRPRGRQRGRRRPDLGNSLSRRWIRHPRSDSAAGNHAGRRRGRGSPFRRPVRQARRQAGRPAADGEKNSGHRGRVRRSRVRHRRAQDHAGPRLQRLRSRQAPRAGAHQHPEARRSPQRPGARQVPRTRALRSPEKNPS